MVLEEDLELFDSPNLLKARADPQNVAVLIDLVDSPVESLKGRVPANLALFSAVDRNDELTHFSLSPVYYYTPK